MLHLAITGFAVPLLGPERRRTLQVPLRDATEVSGVARRPLGVPPAMQGVERCRCRCAWPGGGRRLTPPSLLDGRKALSGGRLSACRTTPFAACRWPG